MNHQINKTAAYGVNFSGVRVCFAGDKELYPERLTSFMEDPAFAQLVAAFLVYDDTAAFERAHMLKGVAENLGIIPRHYVMCGMVEPLCSGAYQNLEQQLQDILKDSHRLENFWEANRYEQKRISIS